jgi:hypothetical protein
MTSMTAAVPLFFVALALMVVALHLIYWASSRFAPAWCWLMATSG